MKNYKSWLAFAIFLISYGYSVYKVVSTDKVMSVEIVEVTGFFLLISMVMMMVRNEVLGQLILALTDILKERFKK